jgi:hypothetical protein
LALASRPAGRGGPQRGAAGRRSSELALGAALAATFAGLLACSSVDSRVREQREVFDTWPPEVQERIRQGRIELGDTREMVNVALGDPDAKEFEETAEGLVEVWIWRRSVPGFAVGLGTGRSIGDHVGIGTGVEVGEPARREDAAVVEFDEQGRVMRFQQSAPR